MKINNLKSFSSLLNNQSKFFNLSKAAFSSKSHMAQIAERESSLLEKLRSSSNFTKEEMGEFARVLKKSNFDNELWQKFQNELPKHVENFDQFEVRKVISLSLAANNNGVSTSDEIVGLLSQRLDTIYTAKDRNGSSLEEFKANKRNYLSTIPLAHRFWIKYYALRCQVLDKFSNFGISSK